MFLEAHPSSSASNPALTGVPERRLEQEVSIGKTSNAATMIIELNFIKFPYSQRVDKMRTTGDELITLILHVNKIFYYIPRKFYQIMGGHMVKPKVDQTNIGKYAYYDSDKVG
jgi:hypothetical protein